MFYCAGCQQELVTVDGCNILEDGINAWILHPACYEKYLKDSEAAEQRVKQRVERRMREKVAEWNALSQGKPEPA